MKTLPAVLPRVSRAPRALRVLQPAFPLVLLLLSACAQWPGAAHAPPGAACAAGQQPSVQDLLYFGTATPDGTVSPADWRDFIDSVVTPRFPDGLSVWPASGQWKSAAKPIVREASFVLNLVHPDTSAHEASIREIVAGYKARFHQEAVMRVRTAACVSF